MTEPTYEYVRGVGWVPNDKPEHTVTMQCGTVVHLEFRIPKKNERWDSASIHTTYTDWFVNKQPNWKAWEKAFQSMGYNDLINDYIDDDWEPYEGSGYIVAVPL